MTTQEIITVKEAKETISENILILCKICEQYDAREKEKIDIEEAEKEGDSEYAKMSQEELERREGIITYLMAKVNDSDVVLLTKKWFSLAEGEGGKDRVLVNSI